MNKSILRFMIPKSLVEYVGEGSTLRQALEKMHFHKYTAIPVIDTDGKYIGTLRSDDLLECFFDNDRFDKFTAEDIYVKDILKSNATKPVAHDAPLTELIEHIKEHNFVPVVDDRGCFIGIILRREILNYLLNHFKEFKF